jgi:serine protease Do
VAQASMVQVRTGWDGAGTGTIAGADVLTVTNAHVARHRQLEVVLRGGRRLKAQVEAFDPRLDLAALRIEAHGLAAIPFGSSRDLRAGELVLAVGHPWGVEGGETLGFMIGAGADLPENPQPWRDLIAVSLHLRPGHSGGPLVDVHGRPVGIRTMLAGPEVGLAIPVDTVWQFLNDRLHRAIARAAWIQSAPSIWRGRCLCPTRAPER